MCIVASKHFSPLPTTGFISSECNQLIVIYLCAIQCLRTLYRYITENSNERVCNNNNNNKELIAQHGKRHHQRYDLPQGPSSKPCPLGGQFGNAPWQLFLAIFRHVPDQQDDLSETEMAVKT